MKKLISMFTAAVMCASISAAAEAAGYQASVTYENGEITISGLNDSAELIHVSYSDEVPDGVSVTEAGNGTMSVNAERGDRFFLWDSITGMVPLADPVTVPDDADDGGALVVYFSATGNTESIAGYIAEAAGADIFELTPVEPYSSADLNWTDESSRVVMEYEDESLRDVALTVTTPENWDSYDTVFIGYPIWWGIAAWPVSSFVEANDFTGKTVIAFCTSSSSGLGESGALLEQAAGSGEWLEGMRFRGSSSQDEVSAWAQSVVGTSENESTGDGNTLDV